MIVWLLYGGHSNTPRCSRQSINFSNGRLLLNCFKADRNWRVVHLSGEAAVAGVAAGHGGLAGVGVDGAAALVRLQSVAAAALAARLRGEAAGPQRLQVSSDPRPLGQRAVPVGRSLQVPLVQLANLL